jgi:hypothetical protein
MAPKRLTVRLIQPVWTLLNEAVLRINTMPPPETSQPSESSTERANPHAAMRSKHDDSGRYEVPDYYYMRKVRAS